MSIKICVVIMKRKLGWNGFCGLIWWNPVNVLLVIITPRMLFQILKAFIKFLYLGLYKELYKGLCGLIWWHPVNVFDECFFKYLKHSSSFFITDKLLYKRQEWKCTWSKIFLDFSERWGGKWKLKWKWKVYLIKNIFGLLGKMRRQVKVKVKVKSAPD